MEASFIWVIRYWPDNRQIDLFILSSNPLTALMVFYPAVLAVSFSWWLLKISGVLNFLVKVAADSIIWIERGV